MVDIKNDKYYVNKIIESIDIIEKTYKGKTVDDLANDISINNIVMFQMILIGENSIRISDEYKNKKKNIEWKNIKGLRNIVVHNYDNVKYDIINDTIVKDMKKLKKELIK